MINPKNLRNYIWEGKFKIIYENLEKSVKNNREFVNEVLLHKAQYFRLKKSIRQGIISRSELEVIHNKLTQNILEIVDEYEVIYSANMFNENN